MGAFDGTDGRRGVRAHGDTSAPGEPFPDPASYLPRADAAAYDAWTAWSHKPASLDYLSPSKEYFSLGKTKAFMGDMNQPGVIQDLIAVRVAAGTRGVPLEWNGHLKGVPIRTVGQERFAVPRRMKMDSFFH